MKRLSLALGILSAALFGIATPLSKILLKDLTYFQLAGLLYLGAALGILPFLLAGRRKIGLAGSGAKNLRRIAGAVLFGGCLGPVLLLMGLKSAQASSVSLWLNFELAATAVLGFLLFKDHLDGKGWLGVGGALVAGTLVTFGEGWTGIMPALLVAAACVCWGMDNNLTALIDGITPRETTFIKGFVAGVVNLSVGIALRPSLPVAGTVLAALALGAVCYGGSIVLYITAAQGIGATRGQILFASAPIFGMIFSIVLLSEKPGWTLFAAAAVLIASILLLGNARHAHVHVHEKTFHIHLHRHDDMHHDHSHGNAPAGRWHVHGHEHEEIEHDHPHTPDLHHRHDHPKHGHPS